MDAIARTYIELTLAVGQHDANYVDAYYGPPEIKAQVEAEALGLSAIRERATEARLALESEEASPRRQFLAKQFDALLARVRMLSGDPMSFDEESAALYDVVDPGRPDSFYENAISQLESLLPGTGDLSARFDDVRSQFNIPADRVDSVFRATVDAARERTKQYIDLPAHEDFRLEYVTGEVWSAYNWYQGNSHSLIQVNMDLPLAIDRALGLACHEGYPGHHVYNALLEQHLVREKGWQEFTVYPLYSPESLIAEGTAEYGVELSFPPEERLAYEREVLFPLAGLDSGRAEEYAKIRGLISDLGYSSNDAARRYLDGKATRQETIDWLVRYSLSSPQRAEQRIRFFEVHRSYVVTYNLGFDLIKAHVESKATTTGDRWKVFKHLLSTPQTPSALK